MTTIHRIACPIPYPLKTVNCYYLNDSCPTLIDSGVYTPESMACVADGIRQNGGSLETVQRVIVTHAHTDHAGLAGHLAEAFGAEVFIHRHDFPKFIGADAQYNRAYFQQFKGFLDFGGLPADQARAQTEAFEGRVAKLVAPLKAPQLLSGGETFTFDDFELRVVPTPGHSAGSVSLVNESDGTLFSGDFLLENITPNPVAEFCLPDEMNSYRSLPAFAASLRWVLRQKIHQVLPGHGPAFFHAQKRAAAILDHFARRRKQLLRMMATGPAAPSGNGSVDLLALAQRMFPGLKAAAIFLGLSESFAYLQLLEAESLVETWQEQGIGRYRLLDVPHP